jgi:hypothetical protein
VSAVNLIKYVISIQSQLKFLTLYKKKKQGKGKGKGKGKKRRNIIGISFTS